MKPNGIWTWLFVSVLFFPTRGFSKEEAGGTQKRNGVWEEVYCVGGDALDSADLMVELGPKEDVAYLTVITGASSDEKDDLKRTFTVHMAKDSFRKMLRDGKIELVLSSDKHPENAFGGETKFAALLELVRDPKGAFAGYAALDGSVFAIRCPKDPAHYFAFEGFRARPGS